MDIYTPKKTEPPKNVDEILKKCFEETRIKYENKDGFFTKKLKGINYVEVGKSKIISNPIIIFVEYLYVIYKKIRAFFQRLLKTLFPRKDVIWGDQKDAYITGRVVFKSRSSPRKPIVNMKVALWGRTLWLQWRKLGEGYTDSDGKIYMPFDLRMARSSFILPQLSFEILEIKQVSFLDKKEGELHYETYHKVRIFQTDLIGMGYNLREIQLDYWNYRTDTRIPRTLLISATGDQLQQESQGRQDAFIEQIIPIEVTKLKHLLQIEADPDSIDIASIQADYPMNLTTCIERELPGYTRGDDFFGRRMMNGMNRGTFFPDPIEPNIFYMKYFGICSYDHNNDYAFPDVKIKYLIDGENYPKPISIHITGAINAMNRDQWQERVITNEDGPTWLAAKRLARVNGALCTEVEEHFTGTHLNTEQYSIPAFRHIRKSPLAKLLRPHLKECAIINHGADRLIIKDFLPSATAMTESGLIARCKDLLGMQDWKNWEPMKVLSKKHNYAKAEKLFWKITKDYVHQFIEENKQAIIENWHEVYLFSDDLVNHAVPVYLSDIDLDELDPKSKKQAEERYEYYRFQYGFDDGIPRERINGELKTVSRITNDKVYDPQSNDLQHLKDACSYAIMMATFMHTWINEHQYDDLGEILYNCGGLRFGEKEEGVLAPESDLSIAPDLTRSTQQMWFTNFLSRTEYGFITVNEDGDVNPLFTHLLEENRSKFDDLGVDIDSIESRTNI